jgi:hypothetical protein
MRDRMPGTLGRLLFQLVLAVMVIAIVYTLISVGVAVTTADNCGGQLHTEKHWQLVPPEWKCGR